VSSFGNNFIETVEERMFLEVITLCNIPFKEMEYQLSRLKKTKLNGLQGSSVSTVQT
jgi:23S rRNA A1618 N6-methylase RlmF